MNPLRKRILFIDAVSHKQLDSLRSWHLSELELRPRRVESVANGFAKTQRPVKCSRKRDASLVADSFTGADRVVDHFGDRARLHLGQAGIEQHQSQVTLVMTQHVYEALLIDSLAAAGRTTENDLVFFTAVTAEM